jgi:hypothetical protein
MNKDRETRQGRPPQADRWVVLEPGFMVSKLSLPYSEGCGEDEFP